MVNKDCKCKSCKCGKEAFDEMIQQIDDNTKPFIETIISNKELIREFKPGYPDHLYKWHSDPENRLIEVLEDSDWRFQYDNELPIQMRTDVGIQIPVGVIHRIIPGKSTLKIKVINLDI